MLGIILAVLTLLLVIATALPLSRSQVWWVRGLDFPRLQLFLAAVALFLLNCFLLDFAAKPALFIVLVSLTVVCVMYQGWWILPYLPIYPVEVPKSNRHPTDTLSILAANVLTPNRSADKLLSIIADHSPDIIVTLESDEWWQQQLAVLEKEHTETIYCPKDNLYGMHVWSRLPLHDTCIEYLVEEDVPSMHACVELPSGAQVKMHFLHPAPPSPTENEESQERDAELLVVAKSLRGHKDPVVVAGDLNDVAWSRTTRLFRKISGLLDPRVGRGMFNTFNARYWFLRWPLDHLFHSSHFEVGTIKRLANFDSDHFPLFTELHLTSNTPKDRNGLSADSEDQSQAQQKINREDVNVDDVPDPEP